MTTAPVATAVQVEAIRTGELRIPNAYAFRPAGNPLSRVAGIVRPGGSALRSPCLAFVLRHPEAGAIGATVRSLAPDGGELAFPVGGASGAFALAAIAADMSRP